MAEAPAFDPTKPFEAATAPTFDASKPFEPVVAEKKSAPDVGRVNSFLTGLKSGATANWADELHGAYAAGSAGLNLPEGTHKSVFTPLIGLARLGYEHLTGQPGEAMAAYEKARDAEREKLKQAKEQYPGSTIAGEVGGALALPGGAMMQAARLPGRIARGAAVGAGYGGISGFGEGEGLADSATKGAMGVPVGAAAGAVAAPIVEGIAQGASHVAGPIMNSIRGAINPEGEAARRVITKIGDDMKSGSAGLSPQDFIAARNSGAPVAVADLGGEGTRALARSAANTSPEGRAALEGLANERFEGQSDRAADFIRNLVGGNVDTTATRDALRVAAQGVNNPAYKAAYQHPSAQGMWDEGFEQISQAPVVQSAIRAASVTGANRGTIEGFGRIQSPFVIDKATGQLTLRTNPDGSQVLPNLQFWDHVKRNLDKINTPEARTLNSALKSHLDDLVPLYKDARSGAAKFFGAEDVLTAGENFVGRSMDIGEARKVLAKMTPEERDLFRQGYAAQTIDNVRNTNDRANVLRQFNSPAERERRTMALGPVAARRVQAFLDTERTMDRLRTAVQGNSTTARQWIERGMAGGSLAELGSGTYHSDPKQLTVAAVLGGLALGDRKINTTIARHVAEMLVSNDPSVLSKGVQMIARHQNLKEAFGDLDKRLARVATQQSPPIPIGSIQGTLPSRAADQQQQ